MNESFTAWKFGWGGGGVQSLYYGTHILLMLLWSGGKFLTQLSFSLSFPLFIYFNFRWSFPSAQATT